MTKARIFVLSKNEYDLIDDFLTYYEKLVGASNITIIDNGSTDAHVLSSYSEFKARGGTVIVDDRPLYQHCNMLTEIMYKQRETAEFLIPLDTDEFMFDVSDDVPMTRETFEAKLSSVPEDASIVRFGAFWGGISDEHADDYLEGKHTRPAAHITRFYNQGWDKVFFRGSKFVDVQQGNHGGTVLDGHTVELRDLGLLHYHETGPRRAFERCRMSICGYRMFDVKAPIDEQLLACSACYQGAGGHRVRQYNVFLKRMKLTAVYTEHSGGELPKRKYIDSLVDAECGPIGEEILAKVRRDATRRRHASIRSSVCDVVFARIPAYERNKLEETVYERTQVARGL